MVVLMEVVTVAAVVVDHLVETFSNYFFLRLLQNQILLNTRHFSTLLLIVSRPVIYFDIQSISHFAAA